MTDAEIRRLDEQTLLQVRVLRLLSALIEAGVEDVSLEDFHAFAFFAEALAPVWSVGSPLGGVLKEEDGPHYPALQRELDRLVGLGLVTVSRLTAEDRGGRWRLDVKFSINVEAVAAVLAVADSMPDEDPNAAEFLMELAFSFADIPVGLRDDAARVDAAWTAPGAATGRIITLSSATGSSGPANYSTQAARHFQKFVPEGVTLSPAEQTSLYMGLMKRRAGA
jgi:hypothetical protein